jgi:hypothetical protein
MCATCLVHLIFLAFIILIIFGEETKKLHIMISSAVSYSLQIFPSAFSSQIRLLPSTSITKFHTHTKPPKLIE